MRLDLHFHTPSWVLCFGLTGPIAIGCRAGRARVENPSHLDRQVRQHLARPTRGEVAHADQPLGFQYPENFAQVRVARCEQLHASRGGQFVRRQIAAARFEKRQWAVVQDEVFDEKLVWPAKSRREEPPEPSPADLRTPTREAFDGSFRVFARRSSDLCFNPQPVAHGGNFAKRDAGLDHPERARVHAEEHDALRWFGELLEIRRVRRPRIVERVVHARHRHTELQPPSVGGESLGRGNQAGDANGAIV